ncbi:hypothetical protein [Actinoalloteichus sp. GBA129-24]|uniref:hypothetical protein n=1 Tax=Actinoalloteichus sp. GBA129-24 TaxID=1612551 RepID=UPI00095051C8|nr:hypothetical protein [Actinoalloteichus sp. GBA129-24]APU20916.1 hypothetical protein UA75_14530 [Actinoalloteichus sp. GBA129-24]APU24165.1 hypothetical protein UA75_31010 [Actinoalloteichus sp. GBA129-24]
MSTQADQIVAAVVADTNEYASDVVDRVDPGARSVDYSIVRLENGRPYYVRRRQVWRLTDGALLAAEWTEGLGKHAYEDPCPEAYRVVAREVTAVEYVREDPRPVLPDDGTTVASLRAEMRAAGLCDDVREES